MAEIVQKAEQTRYGADDLMPYSVYSQMGKSLAAYVGGTVDLDAALKQMDAAWATAG